MNEHTSFDLQKIWMLELEPERYELHAQDDPLHLDLGLGRRDFLRILGGGLLVLCLRTDDEAQASRIGRRSPARAVAGKSPARSAPGCTSARTAP